MLARIVGAAALAFGVLAASASAQTSDVLTPARAGQLQCFEPNVAAKTCQTLGGYAFGANGAITNDAQVLISPQPAIVMRVSSPVAMRNGAICGPLSVDDINRATFTIDGSAASESDTRAIRGELATQLQPMFNQESCMTLTADGDGFRAETTVGGVPQPQQTQRVIWVGAQDGYRVAP